MKYSRACRAGFGALVLLGISGASLAQSNGLPFNSTFDAGNFNEWHGFRNSTGAAIVESGCQSGRCVRAPMQTATSNDNYGDRHFGDHTTIGGQKVEEAWLRLYSKFDAGFIWPDRSQKIAILNLGDSTSYSRYYQVYIYVRPNGQYAVDHSDLTNWRFTGLFQNQGAALSPRPGQWDKLKLHVRLNTPGQANGVVQLWINDVLKVDYSNVNIRQNSTYGMNKLNLSSYSTNSSSPDGGTGVQWFDSFTLSTTDPDGSSVLRPNPPTNVQAE